MNTSPLANRFVLALSLYAFWCGAAMGISPTNGLSLYYSFDEDEGTNVTDEAGSNDGIVYGGAEWISDGGTGGAYRFDGSDDHILSTSNSGIQYYSDRTMACWFRSDIAQGTLFGVGSYGYSCGVFRMMMLSYPSQSYLDLACSSQYLSARTTLNDGAWHHFAVVLDGSTMSDLSFYLDGEEWSTGTPGTNTVYTYPTPVDIGKEYLGGYRWTGDIDEFVIYNRALSASEIEDLYESTAPDADTDADGMPDWWESCQGLNPYSGLDSSLQAWWTFDEGSGAVAYDETANGYDAVIVRSNRYVAGKLGYALEFDGSSDAVFAAQTNAIVDGETFTVSAWVWLDSGASAQYHPAVADTEFYSYVGYWMGFDADPNPDQLEIFWGDGNYGSVGSTNQALYVGQWAHAVGSCDGTNKLFYLNGQLIDSATSPPFEAAGDAYLRIGTDIWGYFWKGKLDDVRIYTDALDSDAVADMYDAFDDPDEDGYSNLEEYQLGRDPFFDENDDDGDGLPNEIDAYPNAYDTSAIEFEITSPTEGTTY